MFFIPFPFGLVVVAFVAFGIYSCTHEPSDHHAPPPAAHHAEVRQ